MRKFVFSMLAAAFLTTACASGAFALDKSAKPTAPGAGQLMPMRVWILPGTNGANSGYYEYFTIMMNVSDLNVDIEAPKYEAVFPAGPDVPQIRSKP